MNGEFLVLRGVLNYAKLTGKPRPHTGLPKYDKGPYWSLDLTPNLKSLKLLEQHGLTKGGNKGTGKMRTPDLSKDKARVGAERENVRAEDAYISLKILEKNKDGELNDPPKVRDIQGNVWDKGNIGNGSIADVKVKVVDYSGAEKGVYLQNVRILDHVPYEVDDFEPLSEEDEYFASPEVSDIPSKAFETDLDDDVPF